MTKVGRNDPCPCGSGRKFKLCHGAVAMAVVAPALMSVAAPIAPLAPAAGTRQCGPCTACCQGWVEGEIRGHRMFAGRPCHFLAAGACTIYEERPQSPCRSFVCGWLAPDSPFPESFRPDRTGVIIVAMRWRDRPAYVLVSAGNDPAPEMLQWMQAFARRSGSPFFYQQNGERLGYGPPAFQQEMLAKLQRDEKLW